MFVFLLLVITNEAASMKLADPHPVMSGVLRVPGLGLESGLGRYNVFSIWPLNVLQGCT